jgi:hypothetical protein
MPFRPTFDCLWCGTAHAVRSDDDLEGWAQLCPTCVGRAGENGFLRFRLRAALDERGRARAASGGMPTPPRPAPGPAPSDDWYLRRGPYARGAIDDALWASDLDAATLWLDAQPLTGEVVELAAGAGWWTPLLAAKSDVYALDADGPALDRARDRLLAHGLRAHLHERDPWAEPDRRVDGLVTAFWLGRVGRAATPSFMALAHRWLRAGGRYVFIELRPGRRAEPTPGPAGPAGRPGPSGPPAPTIEPWALESALRAAAFREVELVTGRTFLLGSAVA